MVRVTVHGIAGMGRFGDTDEKNGNEGARRLRRKLDRRYIVVPVVLCHP